MLVGFSASDDITRVQKKFNLFYLNRLQFLGRLLEEQKLQKQLHHDFDFKPQLNENSTAIAVKYR